METDPAGPVEPPEGNALSAAGQLIITEILIDPAGVYDSYGEWFEVMNVTDEALNIPGLVIYDDDSDNFSMDEPTVLAAGERLVLGRTKDTILNGGAMVGFAYGTEMTLANGGDELVLVYGATVIDRVAWDASWPVTRGASMQLDPSITTHLGNDDPAVWCASEQEFGTAADRGTPGTPNLSCGL